MPPEYILFYENACRYKFMPTTDQLVAPWRKWHVCRAFLLEAFRQTAGTKQSSSIAAVLRGLSRSGARERSLLHLARWSLRARRGRPLSMACDDPVITLAGMFYREFAECGEFRAPSGRLLRLWRTIN